MRERWKAVLGGRELARVTALPSMETELPAPQIGCCGLVGACAVGIGLKGFRQGSGRAIAVRSQAEESTVNVNISSDGGRGLLWAFGS